MAAQSSLKNAFAVFRKSFGRERKQTPILNQIHDAFNAVEEDALPLTELVERTTHLAQVLAENVPLLHKGRARPTLAFCGSIIAWLYETKLKPAIKSSEKKAAPVWEDTILNGSISPILDICDSEAQDTETFGETIYPAICKVMRSSCGSAFGGRFARSLALVLLETCAANKSTLLDQDVFGVPALSRLIIDAKDYHHLDTLLELSFNMFSTQNGKITRRSYAEALFDSDYAAAHLPQEVRAEICRIHEVTNDKNSEKHVLDIIRAMSSAQVQQPQVFTTQDLSYCGTKYNQQAPGNVAIFDNSNICVMICDKDNETDVLVIPFTLIQKIELRGQDASRTLVEYIVSEAPLIFSIREAVKTPAGHTTGVPLHLCVSISSSDVSSFEAALAARNLASKITGNGVLARPPAAVTTKLSQAVSGVDLAKTGKSNLSQENVDEMMSKYVNMPSSPDSTPEPVVVAPKRPAPRKPARVLSRPAKPVSKPAPRTTKKAINASQTQPAPSTGRPRRARTARASKVIEKQVADDPDSEPEVTPEQPQRIAPVQEPIPANDVLPTPPDTHRTKPLRKTLVPGSPDVGKTQLGLLSSPISVAPSPTSKMISKRKRADVEDDPIELVPDTQDQSQKVLPSSQHITPRNTATTRAKAKYTGNAKKMRVSSPDPEPEEEPTPAVRADVNGNPGRSKDNELNLNEGDEAETRPTSSEPVPTTRSTRSAAVANKLNAASKSAPGKSEHGLDTQPSGSGDFVRQGSSSELEVQKAAVGRATNNEKAQGTVKTSGHTVEPKAPSGPLVLDSVSLFARDKTASPEPTNDAEFVDVETVDVGDEDDPFNEVLSSQDDELLAALARAAKKATRTSFLEPKFTQPHPMSPAEETSASHSDVQQINAIEEDPEPEALKSPIHRAQPLASKFVQNAQPNSKAQNDLLPAGKGNPTTATIEVPQISRARKSKGKAQATIQTAGGGGLMEGIGRVKAEVVKESGSSLPSQPSSKTNQQLSDAPSKDASPSSHLVASDLETDAAGTLIPPPPRSTKTKIDKPLGAYSHHRLRRLL